MRLLSFLKKTDRWFLLGVSVIFFLFRFPSLFEPYWYGDEGIYEVIGSALRHGRILYQGIWDNKPPLLYILYAFSDANQFVIRLFSLLIGLLSIISFFYLCSLLFKKKNVTYLLTSIFAFLFAIPFLEGNIANAENFMLFPIITGGYLLYRYTQQEPENILNKNKKQSILLYLAGLLIGIAFMTKIVAVFDFLAFLSFFCLLRLSPKPISFTQFLHTIVKRITQAKLVILGFVSPLLFFIVYFLFHGAVFDFLEAILLHNIEYVGTTNSFLIPQGILILKFLLLLLCLSFIWIKRAIFLPHTLFITLWVIFSLFSIFFSQRPYTHYILMGLPSLVLFLGLILTDTTRRRVWYVLFFSISILFIVPYFQLDKRYNIFPYYQNFYAYITNQKDTVSYWHFFDSNTERDYNVAAYIKMHLTQKKPIIYIWGDAPQIYALSGTLPPGRFTVAYHIIDDPSALTETEQSLHTNKPSFVILLPDNSGYPFSLAGYAYRGNIDRSIIYERRNE